MNPNKITAQEIRFLQVHGFFKPFGEHRDTTFLAPLSEDQLKIAYSLIEKGILEHGMNEVMPMSGALGISGWCYCYDCPSKSKSRLLMLVHAHNSGHYLTQIPKPAAQYTEIMTP